MEIEICVSRCSPLLATPQWLPVAGDRSAKIPNCERAGEARLRPTAVVNHCDGGTIRILIILVNTFPHNYFCSVRKKARRRRAEGRESRSVFFWDGPKNLYVTVVSVGDRHIIVLSNLV